MSNGSKNDIPIIKTQIQLLYFYISAPYSMRILILYISILLFSISSSSAQNILLKEDFNSFPSYSITGWGKQFTGSVPWQAGLMYLVTGSCYISDRAPDSLEYRKVAGICECGLFERNNSNVLMYTPPINTMGRSRLWLQFDSYFNKNSVNGKTERLTIEISTDGGNNWTVVSDVPGKAKKWFYDTHYIDISSYVNITDLRIGFRYSDDGGKAMGGCALDDIIVFEPTQKDIRLMEVSPGFDTLKSFAALNTGITHGFKIYNAGLDTIRDFVINYKQDNDTTYTDSINNVSIAPFETQYFSHSIPDTVTHTGTHNIIAWAELTGDNIHWNDTARTTVRGAYFMPEKKVALETGTGTWHGLSPQVKVLMDQVAPDKNICQVAVHDTDPMSIEEYNDYLYYLRNLFVTYYLLDRRVNAETDSLFSLLNSTKKNFGFASIKLGDYCYGGTYTLDATIKPAVDMTGDYRAILILTEDKVHGTGSGWEQQNSFAGGKLGAMGGFENKPNPVPAADMQYDYVARTILELPEGKSNLPKVLVHNQEYKASFSTQLKAEWNLNNMYATVFFFRNDDSTILNSNKMPFSLTVKNIANKQSINAILYPNPTNERTTLQFYLPEKEKLNISLTDISGRTLLSLPEQQYMAGKNEIQFPTQSLVSGIYIISINGTSVRQSLKLEVVH